MHDLDPFERRLGAALRAEADQGLRRFDPAAIARAAVTGSQPPAARIPWRLSKLNMAIRLATAAVIAALAAGGAFYLTRPSQSTTGGPSPTPAPSTAAPVPVAGGCGGTQVFAGPGPDANLGLSDNPWAAATPADAGIVGYFWYPPPEVLFATAPTGDSPKVLWISHSEQAGQLSVTAHPLGASVPVVRFAFAAATSPAGNYPSLIALPSPGCWHFDLAIGATRATMDLMVASARPPALPSPTELRFDVVNQSHRKVEVSLSGDPGSAKDDFLPGQSGTLTVASQNPHGAVQLSVIAYPECTSLVEGPITGAPMTVFLFDNPSGGGGVILRTEPSDAASPIPAPSNNFSCMSG